MNQGTWPKQRKIGTLSQSGVAAQFGGEPFRLQFGHDEFLPDFVPSQPNDVIDLPDGSTKEDREAAVKREAEKEATQLECRPDKYWSQQIAELDRWPDTKVEWKRKWAKVGKCKTYVWVPYIYFRDAMLHLYVTISYPDAEARLKSIFEDSLREAAIEASVIGIVTRNFGEAVASFKAVFWKLLEQKLKKEVENLKCVVPDLRLAQTKGPWSPPKEL